jgi:beta-N-acetylhexosaminidase
MATQDVVDQFGQLFIMAFDGLSPSRDTVEFLRTFRIGGVILFEDNYESPDQLRSLTAQLQARCAAPDAPLFICSDHEGGRKQRFRSGFTALPSMAEAGRGDPAATEALYRSAARELRAAGVNMNLAPVADVCPAEQPGTIGDRSFGDDPGLVAAHVRAAVRGLQAEGLLACAKHFPGQGATTQDGHRDLPVSNVTAEQIAERDLLPFRAAISAGVGTVMTAHVTYPAAGDADFPASLSSFWLTETLRHQLGFAGLILSDALEMKGIMTKYDPVESGLLALAAGTDILLYYHESDQFTAFYELRQALEKKDLAADRVAAGVARVRRAKERWLRSPAARPRP